MHGKNYTSKKTCLAIFLLISTFTACVGVFLLQRAPKAEPTLRFVSIIHRHGERSPLSNYPNDPYKGESFWPEGLQVLLQRGKESMFELGRFIRHRYDGFLPVIYKPTEIFVTSSNKDRCIISASLVLAGLYPPVKFQVWNPDLLWQPIPVHTLPDDYDNMIQFSRRCDLYSEEEQQMNAFIQMSLNENQEMITYFSQATGQNLTTIVEVRELYDNLQIVGLSLPNWAQGTNLLKLQTIFDQDMSGHFYTPKMIRLRSGVMLNDILTNMKKRTNGVVNFERRLSLYSAHDSTITSLWRGMNMSPEITEQPKFGAALILELHEIKNKYHVKILYKESSRVEKLSVLTIKGCGGDVSGEDRMCAFDEFLSALQPAIITNFEEACRVTQ